MLAKTLFLNKIKKYEKKYEKFLAFLIVSQLNILNPILSYALQSEEDSNILAEVIDALFADVFVGVKRGGIGFVLIVTVLRIVGEYSRGGSKYRFFDIGKQCLTVIIMIIILPSVPDIVEIFLNKHLPY